MRGGRFCYPADVQALVCPHCQTQVPGGANVCTGCGAEVVRGATRQERSRVGLFFTLCAIPLAGVILRAVEIGTGNSPFPSAQSAAGLFFFVGSILYFICAFMLGRSVAGAFRRSQVRFFRSFQHQ